MKNITKLCFVVNPNSTINLKAFQLDKSHKSLSNIH